MSMKQNIKSGLRIAGTTKKYRINFLVIAACLILASCSGQVPTQSEIDSDIQENRAAQLVRVGDTTRAGGDLGTAMQLYQRAATMRPDWTQPLLRLAETAAAAGMNTTALDAYTRAQTLEPHNVGIGRAALKDGQLETALASFTNAAQLAPTDNQGYNGAGIVLDLQGAHLRAQERYMTGIERAPDNLPLKNNLGLSLALAGEYADAIQLLSDAVKDPNAGPGTRHNLSLVYGLAGDEENARRVALSDLNAAAVENNLAFYARLRAMTAKERSKAIFGVLR